MDRKVFGMAGAGSLQTVAEPDRPAPDDVPSASSAFSALRRRPGLPWVAALTVVVLVLAGALVVWRLSNGGPKALTQADVNRSVQSAVQKAQQDARSTPPDAVSAYRRILPSLVTVITGPVPATPGKATPAAESDLGAGVIINAQGAVLTALHVVASGGPIQVQFADGTQTTAHLVRSQRSSDTAVLGVDRLPSVVVPAVMGGGPRIGDTVFPVGNPLGLRASLSAGVVSALNRSVRPEGGTALNGLIQFDAAVNPGNSGGPLLNRDGQVIGIVTSLANPSRQPFFVGIGFAVPIATAGGVAGGPSK
jgi:S1-C subfamily serine protease